MQQLAWGHDACVTIEAAKMHSHCYMQMMRGVKKKKNTQQLPAIIPLNTVKQVSMSKFGQFHAATLAQERISFKLT